ncbi:TPA: NrdH-redoxin [Candidatus Woesearchaeota archaeon]|nr:NrdH-redoxin [Candidatus Woesearchaeota archaeon]
MAKIKVYSTQTCPFCFKLKDFLKEKGVEYEDIDVSADDAAAQEMIKKSGQMGVPQIEINGRIIVGFDKEAIEAELAKSDVGNGKQKEEEE